MQGKCNSTPQYSSIMYVGIGIVWFWLQFLILFRNISNTEAHSKDVDGEQEIDGFRFGKLKSV